MIGLPCYFLLLISFVTEYSDDILNEDNISIPLHFAFFVNVCVTGFVYSALAILRLIAISRPLTYQVGDTLKSNSKLNLNGPSLSTEMDLIYHMISRSFILQISISSRTCLRAIIISVIFSTIYSAFTAYAAVKGDEHLCKFIDDNVYEFDHHDHEDPCHRAELTERALAALAYLNLLVFTVVVTCWIAVLIILNRRDSRFSPPYFFYRNIINSSREVDLTSVYKTNVILMCISITVSVCSGISRQSTRVAFSEHKNSIISLIRTMLMGTTPTARQRNAISLWRHGRRRHVSDGCDASMDPENRDPDLSRSVTKSENAAKDLMVVNGNSVTIEIPPKEQHEFAINREMTRSPHHDGLKTVSSTPELTSSQLTRVTVDIMTDQNAIIRHDDTKEKGVNAAFKGQLH